LKCARFVADNTRAKALGDPLRRDPILNVHRFRQPAVWASRECAMFEELECRCIYVEFSNASVPRCGRVEYRAKLCHVCQAREALLRLDSRRPVALAPVASRYQRTH